MKILNYESELSIRMAPGEVRRYKIGFQRNNNGSHPSWDNIAEGEYKMCDPGGTSVRLQYLKQEASGRNAQETDYLLLTVDARPVSADFNFLPDDRNRILTSVDVSNREDAKNCILSIDLGNTRTVALLIDKVDDMLNIDDNNGIDVHYVPMCWSEVKKDIDGPFESIASLVDTSYNPDPNARSYTECRKSFVKLGRFAVFNRRATPKGFVGKHTLSSPKRYYWDKDCSATDWYAANYSTGQGAMRVLAEQPIAMALARELVPSAAPAKLPNSAMLSAMIAELYEQAVYYISSQNFKDKTGDSRPRRISKIHITYPSTLTPIEKDEYRKVLLLGIQKFTATEPGAPMVEVATEIDEATSVLALYTFSKIKQYNSARFWLATIGRKLPASSEAKIAVIDIGGGTTDLSISQVIAADADALFNPLKATVMLQFRDGINSAGDDFMLAFLEPVKKKVYEALKNLPGDPLPDGDFADFVNRYNNSQDSVKGLKRNFWFDLAIKIAEKCDNVLKSGAKIDDDLKDELEYKLGENEKAWKSFFKGWHNRDFDWSETTPLKIAIDKELIVEYQNAVENTFKRAAMIFGKAISVYNTDIVLFSGKTSEFHYVQEYFKKHIAVPNIETMKNFEVGTWCQGITDGQGKIQDSKVSTALGGALYTLRNSGFVTMDFQIAPFASEYLWGVVTSKNTNFPDHVDIFNRGASPTTIMPMTGERPIYLARRPTFSSTAILSYRVRIKPASLNMHRGGVADGTQVTIAKRPGRIELELTDVQGTFVDGNMITLDDVECAICNMSAVFGLDDERI